MKIYEAICNAMSEVGAIAKTKRNAQQGFNYRGVDDVMNSLQPILVKHRIFAVPNVLKIQQTERQSTKGTAMLHTVADVKYTFYTDDGSHVDCVVTGEGMDTGDKSIPKALSIAFKYACFQIFCIPTEETAPDPDAESHNIDAQKDTKKTEKKEENKEKTVVCPKCNNPILPIKINDRLIQPDEVKEKMGMCYPCYKKQSDGS